MSQITIKKLQGVNSTANSTLPKPYIAAAQAIQKAKETGVIGKMKIQAVENAKKIAALPKPGDVKKSDVQPVDNGANLSVGKGISIVPGAGDATAPPTPAVSISDVAMEVVSTPKAIAANKNYLRNRGVKINSKNPFEIATRASIEIGKEVGDLAKSAVQTNPELFTPAQVSNPSLIVGQISDDIYNMDLQEFDDFGSEAEFGNLDPLIVMANQFTADNFAPLVAGFGIGSPSNFGGDNFSFQEITNMVSTAAGAGANAIAPGTGGLVKSGLDNTTGIAAKGYDWLISKIGGNPGNDKGQQVRKILEQTFLRGFTNNEVNGHVAIINKNYGGNIQKWFDAVLVPSQEYKDTQAIKSYYNGLGAVGQRLNDLVYAEKTGAYSRDFLTKQIQGEFKANGNQPVSDAPTNETAGGGAPIKTDSGAGVVMQSSKSTNPFIAFLKMLFA